MTKIAQYTAKSELDVLVWIETHAHHLTQSIDNGFRPVDQEELKKFTEALSPNV